MSKSVLIIIIVLVVVLLGAIGGGFFMLWTKMNTMPGDGATDAETAVDSENMPVGTMIPLETFIVNLADKGGKRYLRTKVNLELGSSITQEEVELRMVKIRDKFLMILPAKTFADISSTEGKSALREELIAELNTVLGEESVVNIYFTEFVIQ